MTTKKIKFESESHLNEGTVTVQNQEIEENQIVSDNFQFLNIELLQKASFKLRRLAYQLELSTLQTSTSLYLLWKFFTIKSVQKKQIYPLDFDSIIPGIIGCIYISTRIEDDPKKTLFEILLCCEKSKFGKFENNFIIDFEHHILRVLGFDTFYDHPYFYFSTILKILMSSQKLAQTSFKILNDTSLFGLGLLYKSEYIVLSCIYLGSLILKIEPLDFKLFDKQLEYTDIEEIMDKILNFYEQNLIDNLN